MLIRPDMSPNRFPSQKTKFLRLAIAIIHPLYAVQGRDHKSNMDLDLQSLFGLLYTALLIGWKPATPPKRGRSLLVSPDRRHLFVTHWSDTSVGEALSKRHIIQGTRRPRNSSGTPRSGTLCQRILFVCWRVPYTYDLRCFSLRLSLCP